MTQIAQNNTSALEYFDEAENFVVIFPDSTLQTMALHRQSSSSKPEAGGQLFAELYDNVVRIKHATEPTAHDRRSRFSFRPFRKYQQLEINQKFLEGLHFVGDWHTHPESIPKPSAVDKKSIGECVEFSKHDLKGFLLVIIGQTPYPEGIYVGFSDGQALRELKLQVDQT